jgi:hypothetical protein
VFNADGELSTPVTPRPRSAKGRALSPVPQPASSLLTAIPLPKATPRGTCQSRSNGGLLGLLEVRSTVMPGAPQVIGGGTMVLLVLTATGPHWVGGFVVRRNYVSRNPSHAACVGVIRCGRRTFVLIRAGRRGSIMPVCTRDVVHAHGAHRESSATLHADHASSRALAARPLCGSASVAAGDLFSEEDQWRKLELVVKTAREVWKTERIVSWPGGREDSPAQSLW